MAITDTFFNLAPYTYESNSTNENTLASGVVVITHTTSYNTYFRIRMDITTTDTLTFRLYIATPGSSFGSPVKTFICTGNQYNYITNQLLSLYTAGGYNYKLTVEKSSSVDTEIISCINQIYKT